MRRTSSSRATKSGTLSQFLSQSKNIPKRNSLLSTKKIIESPQVSNKKVRLVQSSEEKENIRGLLATLTSGTESSSSIEIVTEEHKSGPDLSQDVKEDGPTLSKQQTSSLGNDDPLHMTSPDKPSLPQGSSTIILKSGSAPAHSRYQELVKKPALAAPSISDILPTSYKHVQLIFNALENVLRFMASRDQKPIYHKIRKAVENQAGRVFELMHLQQILFIWPEAYTVEPVQTIFEGTRVHSYMIQFPTEKQSNPFEVTQSSGSTNSPLKRRFAVMEAPDLAKPSSSFKDMVTSMSSAKHRTLQFQDLLLDRVRLAHQAFLKGNEIPDYSTEIHLRQWHPDFKLESVTSIPLFELPAPVMSYLDKLKQRAKERLEGDKQNAVPSSPSTPSRSRGDIPHLLDSAVPSSPVPNSPSSSSPVSSSLSTTTTGTPSRASKILERIREKQRQKEELEKSKPKPLLDIKKRSILRKIPELAQSICFCFRSARKSTLSLGKVLDYLKSDTKNGTLTKGDLVEMVFYLSILCPEFFTIGDLDHLTTSSPETIASGTIATTSFATLDQVTLVIKETFSALDHLRAQHVLTESLTNTKKYVKLFAQDSLSVQKKVKQIMTLLAC